MKKKPFDKSPKTLEDVSHLFFSESDEPAAKQPAPDRPLVRQSGLVDRDRVERLLRRQAHQLCHGTRIVDDKAQDVCGADMVLAEAAGNPVFLNILWRDPLQMPFKMLDHLARLARRPGLFLRAYGREGIMRLDDPLFIFVLPSYPAELLKAVAGIKWARVRLYHAQPVVLDGTKGVLLMQPQNGVPATSGQAVFLKDGK